MKFTSEIEHQAVIASKVITYDENLEKAFVKGALFTINQLARITMPDHYDDMMGKSSLEYVDRLRLKDVREAIEFLLSKSKEQESEGENE